MSVVYHIMSESLYEKATEFKVNPSSCGNHEHYETYLCHNAIIEAKQGLGITYVFLDEDTNEIHGYVTIKASSLIGTYDNVGYPAIEISELAVSERYEHKGLGREMVSFVIGLTDEMGIGIQWLLLCSDPQSVGFYEKCGLQKIPSHQNIPRESWNQTCVPMGKRIRQF